MDEEVEGKNLKETFFSSAESYQMDRKSNSGSTLIARQATGGGSYGATSTGGAMDTTITFSAPDSTEESTGENDKARLLSQKIREKKQGILDTQHYSYL